MWAPLPALQGTSISVGEYLVTCEPVHLEMLDFPLQPVICLFLAERVCRCSNKKAMYKKLFFPKYKQNTKNYIVIIVFMVLLMTCTVFFSSSSSMSFFPKCCLRARVSNPPNIFISDCRNENNHYVSARRLEHRIKSTASKNKLTGLPRFTYYQNFKKHT